MAVKIGIVSVSKQENTMTTTQENHLREYLETIDKSGKDWVVVAQIDVPHEEVYTYQVHYRMQGVCSLDYKKTDKFTDALSTAVSLVAEMIETHFRKDILIQVVKVDDDGCYLA